MTNTMGYRIHQNRKGEWQVRIFKEGTWKAIVLDAEDLESLKRTVEQAIRAVQVLKEYGGNVSN